MSTECAPSQTLRDLCREYEQMIAANPYDASARYSLGLAELYQERWEEAAEQFRQVTALAPRYADAHARLGFALLRLGRRNEAREAIERALALAPEDKRYRRLHRQVQAQPQRVEQFVRRRLGPAPAGCPA